MGNRAGLSCLILVLATLAVPALAQSGNRYSIDADNSILRIYVGRAGILARMGHNHVMHTTQLTGEIMLASALENSTASFSFPVNSLVVDAPEERERAGDGFDSQPSESAIEGTRENMLGDEVLNAEAFPTIAMTVSPVTLTDAEWIVAVNLDFQGNTFTLEVPASVEIGDNSVSVQSSFTLDHEDIGLSPFSAVGGSLRVAESIDFELQLQANLR